MKHIDNKLKSRKAIVLEAARLSGANIEWRDEPDEKMDGYSRRHEFGSIWTTDHDLSKFWAAYYRLTTAANTSSGPCPD